MSELSGKANSVANILIEELRTRISGGLEYTPVDSTEKWIFKKASASATPATLFGTTDEFVANQAASDSIATTDKIKWLALKHTGYSTKGKGITTESVMLNFSTLSPVFNAGTGVTGITATAVDPTIFTKVAHGFIDGDIVRCSGFTEMTEINGLVGTVNQISVDTFEINGIAADAAETTGGTVSYAGNSCIIGPGEMFVVKLHGVTVADLYVGTCVIGSGSPSSIGTGAVLLNAAAIIDDV